MPARKSESENSLKLSVEISDIKIPQELDDNDDPHVITLDIVFTNTSDHSIVFKKPRSTGFTGQGSIGFPVAFNDVGIVIQRKDDMAMGVPSSSQLMARPPAKGGLQAFLHHRPEDFIVLESGESFSYTFTKALPIVLLEGKTSATKLPPGTYKLFLGYGNDFIGYQLPVDATPPVAFNYFTGPGSQIADLNAWVGNITSNEVEFTIPSN